MNNFVLLRVPGSDWIRDYTPAADVWAVGQMALIQYGGWELLTALDGYRYWNPECLTPDYIEKTLGFIPGFAEIIIQALDNDPCRRPPMRELAAFFDLAEGQFIDNFHRPVALF